MPVCLKPQGQKSWTVLPVEEVGYLIMHPSENLIDAQIKCSRLKIKKAGKNKDQEHWNVYATPHFISILTGREQLSSLMEWIVLTYISFNSPSY